MSDGSSTPVPPEYEVDPDGFDVETPAHIDNRRNILDPEPDLQTRQARILRAKNPLLEAARPLLRILGEMPQRLPAGEDVMDKFHRALEREVTSFQLLCDRTSLRREHVTTARYCLCTAIDEAASSTEWGGGGQWAFDSLAQRFHNDMKGGEKFFMLISRLTTAPSEHIDLLEVMHRILGLGFAGVYGTSAEGRRALESVRHHLLASISSVHEPVEPALSPRWRGETTNKFELLRSIPVWVSASVLGLILFSVFAWQKYWVLAAKTKVETEISQIIRLTPPVPKPLRLSELLQDEIAAGRVTVNDGEKQSSVVFRGDDMFLPARAAVSPKISTTLDRLAAEVGKLKGQVVVTGHSDSQAIRSVEFPNNQVLSEKRAQSVANYLGAHGVDTARLTVVGKGDTEPLADNKTPAGRARNRRVEIVVVQ
ncbi:hypothetical protein B566_EDAN018275 [Ephemera danica]|nr:hypothetical protein B566_EDAN018275 [Ephemera danica]